MKLTILFAVMLSSLCLGCGKTEPESATEETQSAETPEEPSSGNPLTAPTDYLGAMGQAKKSMEGNLAVTSINQAVQMFRVENNRNPASLQELIEKQYLPALPKVPYKMKFQYDPKTGQTAVVPL